AYLAFALVQNASRAESLRGRAHYLGWGGYGFLYLSLIAISYAAESWRFLVYLGAANVPGLVLAVRRRWLWLPAAVLAGTAATFAFWLGLAYRPDALVPAVTVLSVLTAELLAVNPALQLTGSRIDGWRETGVLVGTAAFSYFSFYWLLYSGYHDALAGVVLGFAGLYGALTVVKRRYWPELERLLQASLALSVILLTWGIHLQFSGRWVAILWSLEAVGLVALRLRPRFYWLGWGSMAIFGLAVTRAAAETGEMARGGPVVWNIRALTYAVLAVSLTVASWLMSKRREREWAREVLLSTVFRVVAAALGGVLYTLEAVEYSQGLQTVFSEGVTDRTHMLLSIGWTVYSVVLLATGFLRRLRAIRWMGLGILVVVAVKVFLYDLAGVEMVYRIGSFFALGAVLMLGSWLYRRYGRELREEWGADAAEGAARGSIEED
ncbi:MAG: DUF2339 domain-containing protein, partial [Planctomycetota bacterium]